MPNTFCSLPAPSGIIYRKSFLLNIFIRFWTQGQGQGQGQQKILEIIQGHRGEEL